MPRSTVMLPAVRPAQRDRARTNNQEFSRRPGPSAQLAQGAALEPTTARRPPPVLIAPRPHTSNEISNNGFGFASVSAERRAQLASHLATIHPSVVQVYSRKLLGFVNAPQPRKMPLIIFDSVLRRIILRPTPHAPSVLDALLSLSTPADSQDCRLALVDVVHALPSELIAIWPSLLPFLHMIPEFELRITMLSLWPTWKLRFGDTFLAYLQMLEPLLPCLDETSLQNLVEQMNIAAARPAMHVMAEDDASVGPTVFDLHGLTDYEVEQHLERCGGADTAQAVPPEPDPYLDDENVMRTHRHVATRSAVGLLRRTLGPRPDDQAVFAAVNLMMQPRASQQSIAGQWLADADKVALAQLTWHRKNSRRDRSPPIVDNEFIFYLGDQAMPTHSFINLIWSGISQYCAQDKTWLQSANERRNLRTGFVRELADCMEISDSFYSFMEEDGMHLASKPAAKDYVRMCPVGITQRLLDVLSGYYPFSLDIITPEIFLTSLAENAFANDAPYTEPDAERLASFADHALTRAKELFGQTPDEPNTATDAYAHFTSLLANYLAFDHDFVLVIPSA